MDYSQISNPLNVTPVNQNFWVLDQIPMDSQPRVEESHGRNGRSLCLMGNHPYLGHVQLCQTTEGSPIQDSLRKIGNDDTIPCRCSIYRWGYYYSKTQQNFATMCFSYFPMYLDKFDRRYFHDHSSGAVKSLHRHPMISMSLPLSSCKISTFHHLISKQLIQPFTNPNGPSSKIPAAQYRASSFRSSKGILMGKTFDRVVASCPSVNGDFKQKTWEL